MYIYTAGWLNNYVVQLCPFWCNSYDARLSRLLTVMSLQGYEGQHLQWWIDRCSLHAVGSIKAGEKNSTSGRVWLTLISTCMLITILIQSNNTEMQIKQLLSLGWDFEVRRNLGLGASRRFTENWYIWRYCLARVVAGNAFFIAQREGNSMDLQQLEVRI